MNVTKHEIMYEARRILGECYKMVPELAAQLGSIRFVVSGRMTRAAGKARIGTGEITLSLPFFASRENYTKEFRNTVTHEIAHILSPPAYVNGRRKSHGTTWKAMHRRLGGTGERCHSLDLAVGYTARRTQRTEASCGCGCGKPMKLGPTQLRRHNGGSRYVLKGHRLPVTRTVLVRTRLEELLG